MVRDPRVPQAGQTGFGGNEKVGPHAAKSLLLSTPTSVALNVFVRPSASRARDGARVGPARCGDTETRAASRCATASLGQTVAGSVAGVPSQWFNTADCRVATRNKTRGSSGPSGFLVFSSAGPPAVASPATGVKGAGQHHPEPHPVLVAVVIMKGL